MLPVRRRRDVDAAVLRALHRLALGEPSTAPHAHLVGYSTRARRFLTGAVDHPSPVGDHDSIKEND